MTNGSIEESPPEPLSMLVLDEHDDDEYAGAYFDDGALESLDDEYYSMCGHNHLLPLESFEPD